jgi:uncharacterized protein YaeQ
MARKATIYRAQLTLALVDRGVYETCELTVAQHPSENAERLAARVAAFALTWSPGLAFGRGVSATDEPDAWAHADDGRLLRWLEVGQPDARRLVKASRQAARVDVVSFGSGAARWWEAQRTELESIANLGAVALEDDLIEALVAGIDRTLRWSFTLSGGTLFVETKAGTAESEPQVLSGDPLG